METISGNDIIKLMDEMIKNIPKHYPDYNIEHNNGIKLIQERIKEKNILNLMTNNKIYSYKEFIYDFHKELGLSIYTIIVWYAKSFQRIDNKLIIIKAGYKENLCKLTCDILNKELENEKR